MASKTRKSHTKFLKVLCCVCIHANFLGVSAMFSNKSYQSPIDIKLGRLKPYTADLVLDPDTYGKIGIKVERNEQDQLLDITVPNDNSTLTMNFLKYKFKLRKIQLMFGAVQTEDGRFIYIGVGSEHIIGGKAFPVEVRMIYEPSKTVTNVLGYNYNAIVKTHFMTVPEDEAHSGNDHFPNLDEIAPPEATSISKTSYVAYKGSLTSDTRAQDVLWIVSVKPAAMSMQSFVPLYYMYPDVDRRKKAPIQPLQDRLIYRITKDT